MTKHLLTAGELAFVLLLTFISIPVRQAQGQGVEVSTWTTFSMESPGRGKALIEEIRR